MKGRFVHLDWVKLVVEDRKVLSQPKPSDIHPRFGTTWSEVSEKLLEDISNAQVPFNLLGFTRLFDERPGNGLYVPRDVDSTLIVEIGGLLQRPKVLRRDCHPYFRGNYVDRDPVLIKTQWWRDAMKELKIQDTPLEPSLIRIRTLVLQPSGFIDNTVSSAESNLSLQKAKGSDPCWFTVSYQDTRRPLPKRVFSDGVSFAAWFRSLRDNEYDASSWEYTKA